MEIFLNYITNVISQEECLRKLKDDTLILGKEYNWWLDVVCHSYTEKDAARIVKYILKPARQMRVLF